MISPATIAAVGVASNRFHRETSSQATMTSAADQGTSTIALIGARLRPKSTPASMALARDAGIALTARPNGLINPAATISSPQTRNAPTAAGNPPAGVAVAASSAAPGVDQAAEIGMRNQRLSPIPASPIAIVTAMRPDAACASVAPAADRPFRITAKVLAKPAKAVTSPAEMGGRTERFMGPRLGTPGIGGTSLEHGGVECNREAQAEPIRSLLL